MKSVLDYIELIACNNPNKIVVADPDKHITYIELVKSAKQVGMYLSEWTVLGNPIALYMDKSADALVLMMGSIYAGGFYSFIDIRQPLSRVEQIIAVLNPAVIISDSEHYVNIAGAENIKACKLKAEDVLGLQQKISDTDKKKLERIRREHTDIQPLYVNFTSGSTGVPKGVAVSHRSVIEFIDTFCDTFKFSSNEIFANQAPFDFDVSVKDIYSTFATGGTLLIIPRDYFSNPTTLMNYLYDNKATVLIWAVSAMCFVSIMKGLEYRAPKTIRKIMFSGEVMPIKHLKHWMERLPDVQYVNLYGPTEITCNCTYFIIDKEYPIDEMSKIPIGKPFANERVFLLDENNHEIDQRNSMEEGEICVSGTCVALGYYNNPKKTKEVFVQNPNNPHLPEIIYRTGDVGTYDKDGNLIYISRKDFQIKHLGHRIELGEIESAIMRLDGVERCCCIYDERKNRIILFFSGEVDARHVERELRTNLPQFMIPNKYYA